MNKLQREVFTFMDSPYRQYRNISQFVEDDQRITFNLFAPIVAYVEDEYSPILDRNLHVFVFSEGSIFLDYIGEYPKIFILHLKCLFNALHSNPKIKNCLPSRFKIKKNRHIIPAKERSEPTPESVYICTPR